MAFYRRSKNTDKPILKQISDRIPPHLFQLSVKKYQSDKGCSKYKTYDQLVALIFGQLNKCYTLSDISCGLSISQTFLSDIDLKQSPAKSTMSDGNKNRDYQVFETLYYRLLSYYKRSLKLQHREYVIDEIENHKIKLIDSTTWINRSKLTPLPKWILSTAIPADADPQNIKEGSSLCKIPEQAAPLNWILRILFRSILTL